MANRIPMTACFLNYLHIHVGSRIRLDFWIESAPWGYTGNGSRILSSEYQFRGTPPPIPEWLTWERGCNPVWSYDLSSPGLQAQVQPMASGPNWQVKFQIHSRVVVYLSGVAFADDPTPTQLRERLPALARDLYAWAKQVVVEAGEQAPLTPLELVLQYRNLSEMAQDRFTLSFPVRVTPKEKAMSYGETWAGVEVGLLRPCSICQEGRFSSEASFVRHFLTEEHLMAVYGVDRSTIRRARNLAQLGRAV